jgi:hypothetical protein
MTAMGAPVELIEANAIFFFFATALVQENSSAERCRLVGELGDERKGGPEVSALTRTLTWGHVQIDI